MRRPVGCQESVRRPGGGSELSGVQEARCHLSGDRLQGGCGHSAERGPRVRHQELSRVKVKTDPNSLRVEVRQKSSQRMDADSSLKIYSKRYRECSRRMEDEDQRERSSRIPEEGYRKRDYSLRMEDGSRRRQSHIKTITSGRY